MGSLEEKFQQASLRSHDRVTATITDLEYDEGTDTIVVDYRIGTGEGDTMESRDVFDVPRENTGEYAFVRLCREAGIPLTGAPDDLVGEVVEVSDEEDSWTLKVTTDGDGDDGSGATDQQSTPERLKRWAATPQPLRYAGYVAVVVAFPLVAPAIAYEIYADDRDDGVGVVGALLIALGGVVLWLLVPWLLVNV